MTLREHWHRLKAREGTAGSARTIALLFLLTAFVAVWAEVAWPGFYLGAAFALAVGIGNERERNAALRRQFERTLNQQNTAGSPPGEYVYLPPDTIFRIERTWGGHSQTLGKPPIPPS